MRYLALFVCLVAVGGCAQINIPFFNKSSRQDKTELNEKLDQREVLEANVYVDKGKITNVQRLQQNQNLVIVPFTAGVNVEATDELDRAALMIVKGITDVFDIDRSGKHDHFDVLTADSLSQPDLIIKGHITGVSSSSKFRKWLPGKKEKSLSVEGKMVDARTGEVIMIFEDQERSGGPQTDDAQLGYQIGKNIGNFILSGVE